LKELIELIIKGIVDNPDKVEINEIIGEKSSIFEVRVDSSDIGKVIGRQGRNIKSIRTIVNAAAQKDEEESSSRNCRIKLAYSVQRLAYRETTSIQYSEYSIIIRIRDYRKRKFLYNKLISYKFSR